MRKIIFLGIIAVGVLFSQLSAFSQDEAAKPGYKNGETWVFTEKEGGSTGSAARSLNGTYELRLWTVSRRSRV
jgi:hypothetical protein